MASKTSPLRVSYKIQKFILFRANQERITFKVSTTPIIQQLVTHITKEQPTSPKVIEVLPTTKKTRDQDHLFAIVATKEHKQGNININQDMVSLETAPLAITKLKVKPKDNLSSEVLLPIVILQLQEFLSIKSFSSANFKQKLMNLKTDKETMVHLETNSDILRSNTKVSKLKRIEWSTIVLTK